MLEIIAGGIAVSLAFGLPLYIIETGKAHQARQEAEADRAILARALRNIIQASDDINDRLNDPNHDGGLTDTKVPDADDFNALDFEVINIARDALKRIGAA